MTTRLDSRAAGAVSRRLIDGALAYHSALTVQCHADSYHPASPAGAKVEAWAEVTLAYAAEQGLPIWSAAGYLDFVRRRDATRFEDLTWDEVEGRLAFRLATAAGDQAEASASRSAPAVLLPTPFGSRRLARVTVDGQAATFVVRPVTGQDQAWLALPPGPHGVEAWFAP